ncbi:MAG TPA: ferredoxin reductase [Xanthobacteraceae bacterium]|nr:ferredoxin reductase [Xanthobacteraceae bacterium]
MTEAIKPPVPPAVRWQKVTISRIEKQTPTATSFFFRPSVPFSFRAGQHVEIRLTAPSGYRAQRPYSIASAPEDRDNIELAIEKLATGEVSPFFHEVAQVGDEIEMRGPIGGHFVWEAVDGGPVLLAGAGSGVAPLMSMIRHHTRQGSREPMLLLLSARSWQDVIFRDELLALDREEGAFKLVLTLTREPARRPGDYARRIDAPMLGEVLQQIPSPLRRAYICGSNPFVSAASEAMIAAGVETELIRTERYGQ